MRIESNCFFRYKSTANCSTTKCLLAIDPGLSVSEAHRQETCLCIWIFLVLLNNNTRVLNQGPIYFCLRTHPTIAVIHCQKDIKPDCFHQLIAVRWCIVWLPAKVASAGHISTRCGLWFYCLVAAI